MTTEETKSVDAFLIYGRDNCPYCVKAKELLQKKEVWWAYIDLTKNPTIRERMMAKGFKTVPIIYNGDTLIGGYTDLEKYFNES